MRLAGLEGLRHGLRVMRRENAGLLGESKLAAEIPSFGGQAD